VLAQTPITDYTVQYSSNSGSSWTTFTRSASTTASATVTGLTNGTAYTFRVAGVNGVGTGAYSTASSAVTPTAADPYFSSVSLLLHADGSGSTFVDSSPTPKTISAVGNAIQSATQSKFGGKSLYIPNGTSDGVAITNVSSLIASGNFVLEGFVYFQSLSSTCVIAQTPWDGSGGAFALWYHTQYQNKLSFWAASYSTENAMLVSTTSLTSNTWYYFAVSRSGNNWSLYLNGAREAQVTSSVSITKALRAIGNYAPNGSSVGQYPLNGYIDELRYTVDSDRGYTGSTITVPTAAFPNS
jgi:hypothetical protein